MHRLTIGLLIAAAACGSKKAPPGEPKPTGKPVEGEPVAVAVAPAAAPAFDPMSVFQASGDKLVKGDNDGTNPVRWHGVVLAAVARGDEVVVRAYAASGASDVTKPMARGDLLDSFEVAADGSSVVFESQTLAGRAAEVGALFSFDEARIVWDAKTDKPAVDDLWSCDETSEECSKPFTIAGPSEEEDRELHEELMRSRMM